MEFYGAVEKAFAASSVPKGPWTSGEHKEGELARANRQYLRMHRGKHVFNICAALFGNGFLVSWWLTPAWPLSKSRIKRDTVNLGDDAIESTCMLSDLPFARHGGKRMAQVGQ